jgi:hypothetical protein
MIDHTCDIWVGFAAIFLVHSLKNSLLSLTKTAVQPHTILRQHLQVAATLEGAARGGDPLINAGNEISRLRQAHSPPLGPLALGQGAGGGSGTVGRRGSRETQPSPRH